MSAAVWEPVAQCTALRLQQRQCTGLIYWHFVFMRCGQLVWSTLLSVCLEQPEEWKEQRYPPGSAVRSDNLAARVQYTWQPRFSQFISWESGWGIFPVAAIFPAGIIMIQFADTLEMIFLQTAVSRHVSLTVITNTFKALSVCLTQPLSSSHIVFQGPLRAYKKAPSKRGLVEAF